MIKIDNLSKTYGGPQGVRALKNISLEIDTGDIFGIIGISGAGKSTLLRCLSGLENPTGGTVSIDGELTGRPKGRFGANRRVQMGVVFQGYNLLMQKTVYENIALPLRFAGADRKSEKERVSRLLDMVELADKASFYPAQLSGGQKQRVAIARALATNPKILLCDEPTSALDPMTTSRVLRLLQQINRQLGVTVVIITHEIGVVRSICNKVAVISAGEVAECGSARQVLGRPQSSRTKLLLEWRV